MQMLFECLNILRNLTDVPRTICSGQSNYDCPVAECMYQIASAVLHKERGECLDKRVLSEFSEGAVDLTFVIVWRFYVAGISAHIFEI